MAQSAEPVVVDQKEESKKDEASSDDMIKRQLGAVMGTLVADAGALPLHWVCKLQFDSVHPH